MKQKIHFDDHLALAELPYFDLKDGRLIMDPDLGPVIDAHTHLALTYLMPSTVDLEKETDDFEPYLPHKGHPIDLEIYSNKNFNEEQLKSMKSDLIWGSLRKTGQRQSHTAANLLNCMSDLAISHCVMHAIELPLISKNTEHYLEVSRRHPELITFGSAHPLVPWAGRRIDRLAEMGIKGVKVHPSTQAIFPDHARTMKIYDSCKKNGLPVLFHCGPVGIEPDRVRNYSLVKNYERPIREYPEVTFFLGHSGALQCEKAIDLANKYSNVILDLSCQGLEGHRAIFEKVDRDRIVFGTDWPFYHQAFGLAKVLMLTEGDEELRRKVLYENAARILHITEN